MNEATVSAMALLVWKLKHSINPLGKGLFTENGNRRNTRFVDSKNTSQPLPGFHMLPSNLMARIWNTALGLQTVSTLAAAKILARKWARTIPR